MDTRHFPQDGHKFLISGVAKRSERNAETFAIEC
jgi:hypothetical protein